MKPFRFSLETVHDLRRQKEQTAQVSHSRALTACEQAEARLNQAEADLSEAINQLAQKLNEGATVSKLIEARDWCSAQERRRNELQVAVEIARRNAEVSRRELAGAAREREAMDKFHEKSLNAHIQAVRREEQKHFDEIAIQLNDATGLLHTNLNPA